MAKTKTCDYILLVIVNVIQLNIIELKKKHLLSLEMYNDIYFCQKKKKYINI